MIHSLWNQYQLRLGKLLNFPVNPGSPRDSGGRDPSHRTSNTVQRRWFKVYNIHTLIQCNYAVKSKQGSDFHDQVLKQNWYYWNCPLFIKKKPHWRKVANQTVFPFSLNFWELLFCVSKWKLNERSLCYQVYQQASRFSTIENANNHE